MSKEKKKELEWGETIWDDMTKEQLLRECQRMYSALLSAHSIIEMSKFSSEGSSYWGNDGSGGKGLEKIHQVLNAIEAEYGTREPMYRTFFRYADDLLFDTSKFRIGSNWIVCDTCGAMWGGLWEKPEHLQVGQPCEGRFGGKPGCIGKTRKLEWGDLDKSRGHDAESS